MRVTNQMVSHNTMLYLNNTQKNLLDIQQQLTTGKKISKPSDDPITAVRALKLKTDVSEIKQYKRNVDDATSWMDVTEQALKNMTDMYKRIRELTVQGSSGTYTQKDQIKILEEIKQLYDQLGNEGNVTYAGRHVFSGYKTNKSLIYTEDTERKARLNESFGPDQLEPKKMAVEETLLSGDKVVTSKEIYRMRLAYDNLDEKASTDPDCHTVTLSGVPASLLPLTVSYKTSDEAGAFNPSKDEVYFIQDTGEIVFNAETAKGLKNTPGFKVEVEYEKSKFSKGEQMPDHYMQGVGYESESIGFTGATTGKLKNLPVAVGSVEFAGLTPVIDNTKIVYDTPAGTAIPADGARIDTKTGEITFGSAVTGNATVKYHSAIDGTQKQNIEYEISVSQRMSVNTEGKNVLTTDALRDLKELMNNIDYTVKKVDEYDTKIQNINEDSSLTDDEKKDAIKALENEKRVYTSQIQEYYDTMIGKADNAMKQISNKTAEVGSKANRLELTGNRLGDDNINFTNLLDKAESIDITETMIKLQSNQVVYNSSLMATSKIVQQSLVDFLR